MTNGNNNKRKYSPVDWLVPASDAKGHSERVYIRIQPGYLGMIQDVINSGKFPLNSTNDFIRLAIKELAERCLSLESELGPSILSELKMYDQMMSKKTYKLQADKRLSALRDYVDECVKWPSGNGKGEAYKVIMQTRRVFENLPDDFYRDYCLEEIDKQFGPFIRSMKGVPLGVFSDE